MSISNYPNADCTVPAKVYVVETFGYRNVVTCEFKDSGLLQSVASPEIRIEVGDTVWMDLSESKIHIFVPGGEAISHPIFFKNGRQGGDNGIH